ncbi:MAG: hypothetical protein QW562_04775 [Thermosphaera sp.]
MLGQKDPEGYCIVKIRIDDFNRILKHLDDKCLIQEHGGFVLVRTKSRRTAFKILKAISEKP